ncbi:MULTISPECIES: alpha/beta fold hydrolase [Pseudonocardia]|uniref:2-hydroxymuconate semialdehyde hydrolase n=2 Tax=Pseudonocardia TaxID=1847 RepID=A0A1Y2MIT4_PSEAH|nr:MULTISPECIES: alpha/beta hydrolase [Pseudonocardia]OSY35160.1 2-hydroxymuconate semialdehyde hydrolase [Pseudonocardia autotrophica]TDN74971.1 pimeloyl-ACP methyl ester carboxylesterase [Pseudonocardia autotrophica]BBF98909.1 hydrolase [Pseudonocardia autotrophica]GEC28631.1 hydrolase [Pseudonocardia saturnea]
MTDVVEGPAVARTLAAGSGSISYFRSGSGHPLLFLHAAGGAGMWGPFHERLSGSADVIAPDHPGWGGSDDLPELRGVDDLVYHYLDVLDRLELDRVDLVGASFGGWLAAELAVHSPERFRSLVLLGPVGLRIPGHLVADLFLMTPPQLIAALYHDPALVEQILSVAPETDQIIATYRELGSLARFGWRPFLNNPRLESRLHRISMPTRVIAAGEDRIVPRVHCERYAAGIPDAELVVVDDCGHALYGERPDAVADAVSTFLTERAGGRS